MPRNEEDVGSPRWGHRSRERSGGTPVRGALKTLSPTRLHHRSHDELRCDDQAKVQLEKLDTQVNTLHSDVSGLTQEVTTATCVCNLILIFFFLLMFLLN